MRSSAEITTTENKERGSGVSEEGEKREGVVAAAGKGKPGGGSGGSAQVL